MSVITLSVLAIGLTGVLLVLQACGALRRLRGTTEARGRRSGVCRGRAPTLNVWAVGDASAVGVGVATVGESIMPQAGEELARLTGRRIRWHLRGRVDLRAAEVGDGQLPGVADAVPDVMILSLGVSDVLQFCSPSAWRQELERILESINAKVSPRVPVLLTGIPALAQMPALRFPLGWILGLRGARLNRVTRRLAHSRPYVWYAPPPDVRRDALAANGLHLGWRGCRDLGRAIAAACCQILAPNIDSGFRDAWLWYPSINTASRDELR